MHVIVDGPSKKDYYKVSDRIDTAKGKYKIPYSWKEAKQQIKRIWYGR